MEEKSLSAKQSGKLNETRKDYKETKIVKTIKILIRLSKWQKWSWRKQICSAEDILLQREKKKIKKEWEEIDAQTLETEWSRQKEIRTQSYIQRKFSQVEDRL